VSGSRSAPLAYRTPARPPLSRLAYVFQDAHLLPWRSVLRNVALPLELQNVPKAQSLARAREAIDQVGLSEAADRYPAQLSGGMRMRASLARALVTDPSLFLLDEPFAALDEITRRALADDVLALWTTAKPAVVFVTHNVEEAVYMASRVVVMTRGPGRIGGDVRVDAPLPRPPGFRVTPAFREHVETVSGALAQGMAA